MRSIRQVMRRSFMLAAFLLSCAHVPPAATEGVPAAWPKPRTDAGDAPPPPMRPATPPPTRGPLPVTKTPGGAVIKRGTPPPVVPLAHPPPAKDEPENGDGAAR